MAVSNNLLFVADNKGIIYTLRCNIKNGILQVTPHTVMLRCMLQLLLGCRQFCKPQNDTQYHCTSMPQLIKEFLCVMLCSL